jgi:hypothetical protein
MVFVEQLSKWQLFKKNPVPQSYNTGSKHSDSNNE